MRLRAARAASISDGGCSDGSGFGDPVPGACGRDARRRAAALLHMVRSGGGWRAGRMGKRPRSGSVVRESMLPCAMRKAAIPVSRTIGTRIRPEQGPSFGIDRFRPDSTGNPATGDRTHNRARPCRSEPTRCTWAGMSVSVAADFPDPRGRRSVRAADRHRGSVSPRPQPRAISRHASSRWLRGSAPGDRSRNTCRPRRGKTSASRNRRARSARRSYRTGAA